MIVYFFNGTYGREIAFVEDDGPKPQEVDTPMWEARHFASDLSSSLSNLNIDFTNKRILDVGMGNGNVFKCVSELTGADVFGFDIGSYVLSENWKEERTFPNTDIRNLPRELFGSFDIAYQRAYSVPFKDSVEVLSAVSKALKATGVYLITFGGDDEYEHEDSFIIKILNELYNKVIINKKDSGRVKGCTALYPKVDPVLTPVSDYYYTLTAEEYKKFWEYNGNDEETQKILTHSKNRNLPK